MVPHSKLYPIHLYSLQSTAPPASVLSKLTGSEFMSLIQDILANDVKPNRQSAPLFCFEMMKEVACHNVSTLKF